MSKNTLRFTECVTFSLTDSALVQVKDDYEGAFRPDTPGQTHPSGLGTVAEQQSTPLQSGLQVRIAATHSGIITRNNGFYLPDKMKKGAASFTDNFPKPILLHHEDHNDPVGRVIASHYADTSGAIQDKYSGMLVKDRFGKEVGTITDVLLADFISGRMPFGAQVDVVRTLLKDSILEDSDYEGLGHIQIVANITDREAMQKLLDGRYLTGSVGATTDKAVCSVCRQDWTDSGPCEHKPGGIYDGAKCFIIAGSLAYDEYSFVNVPADRHSKVLQLNYNGVQDNVEVLDDYSGRIYEVRLGFPQYDSVQSKEEGSMKLEDAKTPEEQAPENVIDSTAAPESQTTDQGTEETATSSPEAEVQDEAAAEDSTQTKPEGAESEEVQDEVTPEVEDSVDTEVDPLAAILDTLDEGLSDENEEKLYDMLWQEAEAGFAEGEFTLDDLVDVEKLEDAKLSTEKRKKLAGSTFCGPKRSFPVPDCAHVTAARRLIGRYKGPGDKSSILSCVSRKAKALGCDTKKKDKVQDAVAEVTPTVEDNAQHARYVLKQVLDLLNEAGYPSDSPVLEDEDTKMLKSLVKKLAKMSTKDAVEVLVEDNLVVAPDCHQAVLDEVVRLETLIGDLRDQLDSVRKEYTNLYSDVELLQDELVAAKANARNSKEGHLAMLVALNDQSNEGKDWSELADESLDSELKRLTDEVDMTRITDKLGDGMSREPTEDVDSPVDIQDETNQKRELSANELQDFEEKYWELKFQDSDKAELFRANQINRWVMEGKLPQSKDE